MLAPLLLLLLTIAVFWKILLTGQFTWLNSPDLANQVLPWLQFQAVEWHKGNIPLWDPHHWGGQSLIGQNQPGVAYPLNWILFHLPLRNGYLSFKTLNYYYATIHYMGCLAAYWLCRDLGRSRSAAFLAGAAFGLCGYVGSTDWPQMINGAVWAPVILLFLLRAMRGQAPLLSMALSGACLGIALCSGHHQVPTFISMAVAGVLVYFYRPTRSHTLRFAVLGATMAFFVFTIAAVQLLPSFEYWSDALRWVNAQKPVTFGDKVPYIVHKEYSLNPVDLLGIFIPGINRHANPYITMTVSLLAVIAIATQWRVREVRIFAGIAGGGLLVALGDHFFLQGLLYVLAPLADKARNPSMAVIVFHSGAVVLAAYGMDALRGVDLQPSILIRRAAWGLVGLAAICYTFVFVMFALQLNLRFQHGRIAMAGLTAILLAVALTAWRNRGITNRALAQMLIAVAILEIGSVTGWNHFHKEEGWGFLDPMTKHGDIVNFLRAQPNHVRVAIEPEVIPYNFGDWHGIDQMGGYAGVTNNVMRIAFDHPAHMMLGINFYIGRGPSRATQTQAFESTSGLYVYRNPDAFPETWTVHKLSTIRNETGLREKVNAPLETLRNEAFLEGQLPALERCNQPDTVHVTQRTINHIKIAADMGCKGMVILGDTYDPGWHARVDGRPVDLHEAYTVLRGVVVPGGKHEIDLEYAPRSVYAGAALTGVGSFLLAALVLLRRRLDGIQRWLAS